MTRDCRSGPLARRRSGILLHLTSLPGAHGNGDLGPAAHRFARFLASAGQSVWQMLPVVPPGAGNSPYDGVSSFAGAALLVSLERLAREGWLHRSELGAPPSLAGSRVCYPRARAFREPRLRLACERFIGTRAGRAALERYLERNQSWLDDYALFRALKQQHRQSVWTDWEPALRSRRPAAVMRARRQLAAEIRYQVFLQYQFDRQWSALRATCRRLGITLLGDLPMFVSHDSADVWANPELFLLDRRGHRIAVAGVPPDAFSRTGQLWGNPLYRWKRMQQSGFAWHLARIRRNLRWYDVVRLDHFIGLYRCWRVDARARTARRGRFVRVPGDKLLTDLRRALGGLPFVAEDLGLMIPEVHALRDQFGLPGMRVLQFGFDADGGRLHQPHRYPPCSVAYTGTHDNDTLVGWIRGASSQRGARARRQVRERRRRVLRYAGSDGREIHWDLIRVVLMSAANTTVFPVQDLLGLGCRARMNRPGTASGNWEWRLRSDELTPHIAERLGLLCEDYERTGGAAGLSSNAASRQRD